MKGGTIIKFTVREKSTREKILKASLRLFSEKGIRETTIKDIAREVGITEGAIYRHFRSKDEIVLELFRLYSEEFYNRLISAVRSSLDYRERFQLVVHTFLTFCFENPSAFRYLDLFHYLRAGDVRNFSPLPKDAILELIEEGTEGGMLRIGKEYALAVFVGTLERVFLLVEAGLLERKEGFEKDVAEIIWKALI